MRRSTSQMFLGVLETPLQFIFVTSLSNTRFLTICGCWFLQNLEKRKKSNKFNRLQIEVFFLPNISTPLNIDPSNLSYVRIYAQGVLTEFYGILFNILRSKSNRTTIFGQLIEYNTRNIFLEKSYTKCGGETIPRIFSKNQN